MRIGIATSLALIGHDQSAVGEAILLAPRLGNAAPANSIVVSESTRKLLANVFDSERLGSVEFSGLPEPVTIYPMRGSGRRNRFFARRTEKLTAFVGREHEFEQVATLWERAKSGKGQVALVNGDAGIGKSRFCEAFLQNIANQSHYVLRYQCSPYHRNTPFYPVINGLEHAARFEPGDTADTKLSKLDALLSQVAITQLDALLLHIALLSIPTDRLQSLPEMTLQRQRDSRLPHWFAGLSRLRVSDRSWLYCLCALD